jgi:hypothetical protein
MFEKKSIHAKHVFRLEHIIQNRLRDEFPLSDTQLAAFSDWIDAQLLVLETEFGSFVTGKSRRGSLGR